MSAASHDDGLASESERLHERVRAFARAALAGTPPSQGFDALALDIARFQARRAPGFARLCAHHGRALERLEHVPAVPADVFRIARVAVHPPALDVATFRTSGTTGGSGRHFFRALDTYAELAVSWGRRALLGERAPARCTVLALAPPFEPERRSSLGYMLWRFMAELDGRSLAGGPFEPREPGRWLIADGQVDLDGLRRAVRSADARGEPVLLLATAFALVWLLDALAGSELPLPAGSVLMLTGGFKGRARSIDGHELGLALCRTLALPPRQLIGEYGMTELSSQLYDRGFDADGKQPSVFVEPPWLRVTPVDPISLQPVPPGEVGLACFTDLANVDSALRVLTQDMVRREAGGVVLIGRQSGARLRGCSLAIEALEPAVPRAPAEQASRGALG
ncbi:MAG TPA: acyl-protein synthetase [Polyangiaceae bacterium]|nr:acyl-protein synthetase [Polyangiaceae bacterium]